MNMPTPVPLSSVPIAGVWAIALPTLFLQLTTTSAVDLANGFIVTGNDPTALVYYFPNASINLG